MFFGVALPLVVTAALDLKLEDAAAVAGFGCLFACILHFVRRGGYGILIEIGDDDWDIGDGGGDGGGE